MPAQWPGNLITKAARALTSGGFQSAVSAIFANFPLRIMHPRPELDTENRYYKAYPGFEYNVSMAVEGGVYPFLYELVTAPSGMVIDSITGIITWPSPPASGTPYPVTAKVTDDEGTVKTVSWTILVTTAGFVFVDANALTSGDGSIGSPYKTLKDLFGGDTVAAQDTPLHAGEFVYWRQGTYQMDAYRHDMGSDGLIVRFKGDTKPKVWLKYPGDARPVFDLSLAILQFENSGTNLWLDDFEFTMAGQAVRPGGPIGVKVASIQTNVMVRRCLFRDIVGGTTGGNNALFFMYLWGTAVDWAFQDNVFQDVDLGYGLLGYRSKGVLVEGGICQRLGSHGIGAKATCRDWTIRGTRFRENPINSVWLYNSNQDTATDINGDYIDPSGNIEVSHIIVEPGGGDVSINGNYESQGQPVYFTRCTISEDVRIFNTRLTNGPFSFKDCVIINSSPNANKLTVTANNEPSRIITENNLTGVAADGIVDANGDLTAAYSEFIGSRGHQVVRN